MDEESNKKGSHLLHYAHELALKDMEISKFRKSKSKIESKYRDLQKSTADMQQQYKADIDKLNQQLIRYIITLIYIFFFVKKNSRNFNSFIFSDLNRVNLGKVLI